MGISFGLSPGVPSSDLMIANTAEPSCANMLLSQSPNYPNAFRFEADFFGNHFLAFDPPTLAQMSGAPDMFTVMDFVIIPTWDCLQFLTVDDVMIPAVCEDTQIRQYFQRNGIWDFGDFEAYFHGHRETWVYKPESQSIKLRTAD